MPESVPVTFAPAGATVHVPRGTRLIDAARAAGVLVAAPCGGRGECGGCGVRVVSGELEAADEIESRSLERGPAGVRLACRARIAGPVVVRPLFASPPSESTSGSEVSVDAPVSEVRLVAGIDLGTTTVAALLVDADTGREVARAGAANRQAVFGADVLSRVSAALLGEGEHLQSAAEESVIAALRAAATVGGVDLAGLRRVVIAGNSAMGALLSGVDVSGLAAHPFDAPTLPECLPMNSGVRTPLPAQAELIPVPPMASFVGGDALAAALSAGLIDVEIPTLLVDIGTNAEIVLALCGCTFVASAAAGPAFEGAGLSSGGPATPGAVESVEIVGGEPVLRVMGGGSASWLSGAGFVSAVAALVDAGHISHSGAMDARGPLSSRFCSSDAGVAAISLSRHGAPPILLTQLDVRALQLAKAAVRAGIETVLRRAGVSAGDLGSVLVAGAFGAALDPRDLIDLGVLPSNVGDRVHQIGNAALEGAAAMALDPGLLRVAARLGGEAVHVDLAADEGFNATFVAATELAPYTV